MTWPEAAAVIVFLLVLGISAVAAILTLGGAWPWQHKVADDYEEEETTDG